MDYFKRLPSEITADILSRVPTDLVFDCKLVCKTWNYLISRHPSFYKMHIHHHINHPCAGDSSKLGFLAFTRSNSGNDSKFHYLKYYVNHDKSITPVQRIKRINFATPVERIRLIGSIHGLICFSRFTQRQPYGTVCICNPITKEYVELPEIQRDHRCRRYYWTTVFGFVSSTNEYKVVVVMAEGEFTAIQIYTLGSGNGWRNLGNFSVGLSVNHLEQGSFANGAIYFMSSDGTGTIVTFDLSEEKFCENLPPPPLPPQESNYWRNNKIGVLDGFLYLSIAIRAEDTSYYDIWFLRKKNQNHDMKEREEHQSWVWSRGFRVIMKQLLAIPKSDIVLTYESFFLNIYDTEALALKTVVEFEERLIRVLPHENSFVSLKELGEENTEITEFVEYH